MLVNFTKMHGLGNDFVIIDLITQNPNLHSAHIKKIAHRQTGIGCDQVITIEPPINKNEDFYFRIFNPDGNEVENCGNGARCAAKFVYDCGFANNKKLVGRCIAGPITFDMSKNDFVKLEAGKPKKVNNKDFFEFNFKDNAYKATLVSFGNPHAVIFVDNIKKAQVNDIGIYLNNHDEFPQGINVEFVEVINENHVKARVFERGAKETYSCGTGALAIAVAGQNLSLLKNKVKVEFKLGFLEIERNEKDNTVFMSGPTTSVYLGRFRL